MARDSKSNFPHAVTAAGDPRRFTFISTCITTWGGSEELWSRAACVLAERGHYVSAFKALLDKSHSSTRRLKSLSCRVHNLWVPPRGQSLAMHAHLHLMALRLRGRRPDLVLVSQGGNYDGLRFGQLCRKLMIPYALVSQKASELYWPPDSLRCRMRSIYEGAARCFFVSEHNRLMTEDQIAARLSNAAVVRNPYLVPFDGPLPWPERGDQSLRLACVARLYLLEKGQDILLRVLAREKWRGRSLHVSFYGQGSNAESLSDMAARLGLRSVSFEGQTEDVAGIWREHHALVLASRAEGLPLVLVEAMMCGRPAIVTKVGGNAEVVEDGATGFLATPDEDSLDAALERAWEQRGEMRAMGERAALRIRELVPANPAEEFADLLSVLARTADSRSTLR